jgi:hypothetical protein
MTFVVKDKHLGTQLGSVDITLTQENDIWSALTEVDLTKTAILGEYKYEIVVEDKTVKTGELIHSSSLYGLSVASLNGVSSTSRVNQIKYKNARTEQTTATDTTTSTPSNKLHTSIGTITFN